MNSNYRQQYYETAWADFSHKARQAPADIVRPTLLRPPGLTLDLSGQRLNSAVLECAQRLLRERDFDTQRKRLLSGREVNATEQRAAWHTALREPAPAAEVALERQRMNNFVRAADSERRWRTIVHIGIGGSDWGVRLAVGAFGYRGTWRRVRFVSNIDGHAIQGGLAGLDPRDTLIVLASKSFTTSETLQNGLRAVEWLRAAGIADPYQHVVAVTARPEAAQAWGVPQAHVFRLWDWVGGRFSIWSSVGLTVALAVGTDVVAGMHTGAAAMDAHFAQAPLADNAPVQMALAGIINRSVLGYGSLNIAPYDFRLAQLIPYIQQLEMESLGKSVGNSGETLAVSTGPAVWGMPGTDAQHTFFQWLHQSSDGAPVDFIVCQEADHGWPEHHRSLLANCLAQREALMRGKNYGTALAECLAEGMPPQQAGELAHHRVHPGGRPSTLIVLPRLNPYSLGALLALYEHKVFVQGVVWGINPFDQWGVEYGKVLAKGILFELAKGRATKADSVPARTAVPQHDASTAYWVETFARSLGGSNDNP